MDEQTATRLIKDTFENPFEKAQFINFSKNLVNHLDRQIILPIRVIRFTILSKRMCKVLSVLVNIRMLMAKR